MKRESVKTKADSLIKLSVAYLRKNGFFRGVVSGDIIIPYGWEGPANSYNITVSLLDKDDSYVEFSYASLQPDGQYKDFKYRVPLVTTACRYGGIRYWFRCSATVNGKYCGKRVAVLFKNGDYFACRHCHSLSYASRSSKGAYGLGKIDADLVCAARDPHYQRYYRGKPTRKFRRALKMSERFNKSLAIFNAGVDSRLKKTQEKVEKVVQREKKLIEEAQK